jgi:uncharacterized protein YqhQ
MSGYSAELAAPGGSPVRARPLRVGGMAFGNGVFMRGPNYWAWAREDGTVLDAPVHSLLKRHRWLRAPLVRSAVALLEMLTLSFFLHRKNGLWRGARLGAWLAMCVVADLCFAFALPFVIRNMIEQQLLLGLLDFTFGLLALRYGLGKNIWRYHGAEHKAVNAYEQGVDLADVSKVMTCSRVHDRCGTNLAVLCILLVTLGYPLVGTLATAGLGSILYAACVLVLAMELFRLLAKRPRSRLSRTLLAGGKALQRGVTTREPAPEHTALACAALSRVLELESSS